MEYAFETEVSSVICTCNPNNKCKTKKKIFLQEKREKSKEKNSIILNIITLTTNLNFIS